MKDQHFCDIVHQGVDVTHQMSFLVEKEQYAVFFEFHRAAIQNLTSKMEVEVTKQLGKTRLERAGKKCRGGAGAAYEERVPHGRAQQRV